MGAIGREWLIAIEWEALHYFQHLQHGNAAGAGWARATDFVCMIFVTYRLPFFGLVVLEVGQGQVARVGRMALHRLDDILRRGALIKDLGALLGNQAERCRSRLCCC